MQSANKPPVDTRTASAIGEDITPYFIDTIQTLRILRISLILYYSDTLKASLPKSLNAKFGMDLVFITIHTENIL
jgi:hypothetical protein